MAERVSPRFDEDILALPAHEVARLAGVSTRRLRYWADNEIVVPSVARQLGPRRTVRLYGFEDVMATLIAARLRETASLQHIAHVLDHLRRRHYRRPLTELRFAVQGNEIYFQHPDGSWEGGRRPDQGVIHQVIPLDEIRAIVHGATRRPAGLAGKVERQRGRLGSKPVFAGTRIPVSTVRTYLERGYTAEDVVKAYPSLTLDDIEAARSA